MAKTNKDVRESIDTSWTVVIGPRSGTLTFRRLVKLFWFSRIRSPLSGLRSSGSFC
jgi:hypothetical protein